MIYVMQANLKIGVDDGVMFIEDRDTGQVVRIHYQSTAKMIAEDILYFKHMISDEEV